MTRAQSIKKDLMSSIAVIRDSMTARAKGNAQVLDGIANIMSALDAKEDAFWLSHDPLTTNCATAHLAAWKAVAAEVIVPRK